MAGLGLLVAGTLAGAGSARAASATWLSTATTTDWNTTANWSAAFPNGTGDTATFSNPLSGTIGSLANPITLSAAVTIQNMTFTSATVGAYNIGAVGGTNGIVLRGTGTGGTPSFGNSINIAASGTNAEVVNTPLSFSAASSTTIGYSFLNNSTTTAATLTLSGALTANTATNRNTALSFDGSNTGNNTYSGVITSTLAAGGVSAIVLAKNGTGRWILSGANVLSGANITSTSGTLGVQVNAGTLVAGNNQSFGTSGTANANQVWLNNGGTVEIATGITLDNGVSLNLNSGGTVKGVGTAITNGRVNVGTTAATSVTLSTASSSDVFTVGNGTGDFTGGASDSVVHIAGPGTVLLAASSSYAGMVSIDSGTLSLNSDTALGAATSANVILTGSGKLQLASSATVRNPTVIGLNSASSTAVVEAGSFAGTSTLTVNNAGANTYAGILQNGSAGTLKLTKGGAGTLNLSGTSTYTGATTIGAGMLNLTGQLGNTATAVNAGGTLAGSGTITGTVTVASTGVISPGNGGTGTVGTLTLGGLVLSAGSQLNYDVASTSSLDQISVTNSGGLTINGGQFNLNGGTGTFTTAGVYNLIGYTGAIGGTGTTALTLNSTNQNLATDTYTFGTAGGYVTLTVAGTGTTVDYWNVDANGNWSIGSNWTAGVPNAVGAFASFGGGGTTITAPRTVTVDGAFTIGTLAFNNPTQAYTLAAGAGGNLTLDNGASGSFVSDTAGSHAIQVPLTLTANGAIFTVTGAADTLSVSGAIGGSGTGLIKAGLGTLALTGTNTYTGGTTINAGTISITSASSLGDVSGAATINGGTLEAALGISSTRNFFLGSTASTIAVDSVFNYSLAGVVADGASAGTLNKTGTGTLTLTGTNTYTGGTVIKAGTLNINTDLALGAVPGSAATNLTIDPGAGNTATLQAGGAFTMNANRGVVLNSGTASIDTQASNVTVAGVISGSGALSKTGSGTLTLTGNNSGFSSAVTIAGGTIALGGGLANGNNGLGTGTVTFQGGTLSSNQAGAGDPGTTNTQNFSNNFVVASGQTGTLNLPFRGTNTGTLTGAGTFNVNTDGSRDDQNGNWSAFTGQINIAGGDFRINTTAGNGFGTARVNLTNAALYVPFNFTTATTFNIGELSGATNSSLAGGPVAGRIATFSVGGANTNATFAGVIKDSTGATAIAKVGTGTWTLTGTNTFSNSTTISAGVLQIGNGGTSGTLGTGTVTDNAALFFNRSDSALTLSNTITGTGYVNQVGTGNVTYTGTASVAAFDVKSGTLTIGSGGNVTTTSFGGPGQVAGDNGTLAVVGTGLLTSNSDLNVGDTGSAAVAATGTLNIQDTAAVTIGTGGGLYVGASFSANTLSNGTVNQTGGTLTNNDTAAGTFVIGGRNDAGGTGVYNISAGTATAAGEVYVGGAGTGTLNVSGTGAFNANAGLRIGNASAAAGVVNLDGGTVTTTLVETGGGSSTFNFNGGTLKAGASSATFMTGLTAANVKNGGANIDTNGNSITIGQPLLHAAGATTDFLAKNGAGTLILTGANTYTGGTTINAGTLLANNGSGSATGTGGVNVVAGTLGGTGTVSGVATVSSGATLLGGAGAASGALTLSSYPTLVSGSLIELALGTAGTHSTINLSTGSFNGFNSNQAFTLDNLQLGTYDNIITGVASGIATGGWTVANGTGSGFSFMFTDDGSNIDLNIVSAVPEPATYWGGLLLAGVIGWNQRRRLKTLLTPKNA